MVEAMTPSGPLTSGQIAKFQELLAAALRKSGLPSAPVQQILETRSEELVSGLVAGLRTMVEAIAEMFSRHVTVNLSRTPQQALDATDRQQYVSADVVAAMPRGENIKSEVFFFKLGRYVSDNKLDKEYDLRGLKPVDPVTLSAVNEADPAFADKHPNGTHFKDADGNWCFATFSRWYGERGVFVDRGDRAWLDDWWFAGVRK